MRKAGLSVVLCVTIAVLAALMSARLALAGDGGAVAAMAAADRGGYNILDLDLPLTTETAGSALVAELNIYYLTQPPTARSAYSGLWAGKNLILIRADNWRTGGEGRLSALYRLRTEGADISQVYAPDWYQGEDGREFALLTGIVPTTVEASSAMVWAGSQGTYLPYALGRRLGSMGYTAEAAVPYEGREAGYAALGVTEVTAGGASDLDRISQVLPDSPAEGPFFLYCVWTEDTGERALTWLLSALKDRGLADSTALCLLTGGIEEQRGGLYLWGGGLGPVTVDTPCSELDVTPTLLNLLGAVYDSRFLAGRDILAPADGDGAPLVSLTGSAWSDWVTARGRYTASEDRFTWPAGSFSTGQEAERYARHVKEQVYARYVFSRRAMENNYFRIALGP